VTEHLTPAVVVERVNKQFRVPHERMHTLKERALHPFKRGGFERFQALDDISFEVHRGEFFGIVGRNGSGKSTLLKCMAGVYGVDRGAIYLDGRVSTFIELGVGFNPDLAARDNVVLNAIMMGLTPSEARARFERVIEFAELEEFVDLKLKNYSSGMHVRLAFSVMIQVDADVLLIDEVLAVGDAAFQQKCYDEFNRMRDEGRTIVLVTHDMAAVNRFCHRAMLIERGEIVTLGDPAQVSTRYVDLNFNLEDGTAREDPDAAHPVAEIVQGWFEDEQGSRTGALGQGQPCRFKARVRFRGPVEDPLFTLVLENEEGGALFATSTMWTQERTGRFEEGDEAVFAVSFENPFMPGRYYATSWIARHDAPTTWIHRRARIASLLITGAFHSGGQVDLAHDVAVEHVKAKEPSEASA